MNIEHRTGAAVSRIAAAIGEPARARILLCLMDGRARTSTELAVVAEVTPSTASVHLKRLNIDRLIQVQTNGRHRFYRLQGPGVAGALEALSVLAGSSRGKFVVRPPNRLRAARTCYDHIAGLLGVSLHDRFTAAGWLSTRMHSAGNAGSAALYDLTPSGNVALEALGIDIEGVRALRRRFACACLDWSERRPHLGGALGAALLTIALKRKWVVRDLDSRALGITRLGRREMLVRFGLQA
jgi:DNA-binding transcriptional ArsR family regulator